MKQLVLLFLTLPFFTSAQDCKLKKETDPFSQQPKLSTGFIRLPSTAGQASLNLVADAKEIRLLFSMGEGKCFDDQSTATISFDSTRSKSSQRNATSMNCEGIFTVVFRNAATTPAALQKMTLQAVSSIVLIDNTKKKIEIFLKEPEKKQLLEKAACLVKEAKTLIKANP
jgi:hypothetical protein